MYSFPMHRNMTREGFFFLFFLKQVVQQADGDEEKRNRGDIIPGIINTAPVLVICMSGRVNEGDGLRRICGKSRDGFTQGAGERGRKH